jgi:hypothetical protein
MAATALADTARNLNFSANFISVSSFENAEDKAPAAVEQNPLTPCNR